MIISLPRTSSRAIAEALVGIRDTGAQVMTGRVLTLIVVASPADSADELIRIATDATREHPARVLMVLPDHQDSPGDNREIDGSGASSVAIDGARAGGASNVDADIRIGGDAGASEIVVMTVRGELSEHIDALVTPLLLPDTPIVAWWPSAAPANPSCDAIGRIAQRRITDTLRHPGSLSIASRRDSYAPGDTDVAWARLTPWRGVVASVLDRVPFVPVVGARVSGPALSPAVDLAGGWLADRLDLQVFRATAPDTPLASPVVRVELDRADGSTIVVAAVDEHTLWVSVPGHADALVAASQRSIADCLAEELRHLDPDHAYAGALRNVDRVLPDRSDDE